MRPLSHLGKILWRTGCLFCHCVNTFLILLVVLQTGLLALNLAQKEVPVPDKLARMVINRLGPDHLETYWSKASFDLRAGLLLDDLSIRDNRTEQTIATVSRIRIQWSPLHIILGTDYPLRELNAMGVQVFLPVSYSPSGLNEPALNIQHVSLLIRNRELLLDNLILRSGGFRLHLTGSARLSYIGGGAVEAPEASYWKALQALKRLPQDRPAFLEGNWHMSSPHRHELQLEGIIPSLSFADAALGQLQTAASVVWTGDAFLVPSARLSGNLEIPPPANPDAPASLLRKIPNCHFSVNLTRAGWSPDSLQPPAECSFQAAFAGTGIPFRQISGQVRLDRQIPELDYILSGARTFSAGRILPAPDAVSWKSLLQPEKIEFRAEIRHPVLEDYLKGPAPDRRLVGCQADYLKLSGILYPARKSLQAFVQADGLIIGQTPFARVSTRLHYDPLRLRIDGAHVRKAFDEYAFGSYWQDFETSRFSLNVGGAIYPPALDRILGDWWLKIFTNITAPVPIPGNVTVWGSWRDFNTIKHITHAHAEGAYYNGVRVPDLRIRVRSNDRWAAVEMLEAEFPTGSLEGTLAIRLGMGEERWQPYLLDLTSTADWESLSGASGIEELRDLTFNGHNPEVRVEGVVWKENVDEEEKASMGKLSIGLEQDEGSCLVKGLRVEDLSLKARYLGQTVAIEPLSGIFAGGIFTGGVYFGNWLDPPNRYRHYDLDLFEARYDEAIGQFADLADNPQAIREALVGDNQGGKLDLDLNLWKQSESEPFSGYGYMSIREAQIGQIHVFGGLSRLLDGMGLGFSTLDLDSMSVEWELENKDLIIDNSLVTGPFLELALAGSIDLEERKFALQAAVTPFRNVFTMVVSPVSETLQFDLTGPLESPNWRIRFKPFRWFTNRLGGPAVTP